VYGRLVRGAVKHVQLICDGRCNWDLPPMERHPDATLGPQGHHEMGLYPVLRQLEIVVTTDQSQQERPFN
jgi:hypothetical protein